MSLLLSRFGGALFVLAALLAAAPASAQTTLSEGDLAILAVDPNTGAEGEQVSFVLLTAVEAGTIVRLSDFDVAANGTLTDDSADGILTVTLNALPAGTVVTVNVGGSVVLATPSQGSVVVTDPGFVLSQFSGDSIVAYQGNATAPSGDDFLYYVNGGEDASVPPSALTDDSVVIITGLNGAREDDGFSYDTRSGFAAAPTSGTRAALIEAFNNTANYALTEGEFDPSTYLPASFTVTALPEAVNTTADNSTSGDGLCTLREAINKANGNDNGDCGTGDYIGFNIPTTDPGYNAQALTNGGTRGVWTIETFGLPALTGNSITIDGLSQPGASGNTQFAAEGGSNAVLRIEITRSNDQTRQAEGLFNSAITIQSSGNTVQGLVINGTFRNAVSIVPRFGDRNAPALGANGGGGGSFDNAVRDLFIGVEPDGVTASGSLRNGIYLSSFGGILLEGEQTQAVGFSQDVRFNEIGSVIFFETPQGRLAGFRNPINVIGNASNAGILAEGFDATDNLVGFNTIGLGADGVTAIPNGTGIEIEFGAELTILAASIDDNEGKGIDRNENSKVSGNIRAATVTLSNVTATSFDYTLQGQPNTQYGLLGFVNEPDGDVDEGQVPLLFLEEGEGEGSLAFTNGSGQASGTVSYTSELPGGWYVTATATELRFQDRDLTDSRSASWLAAPAEAARVGERFSYGPTSEFSNAVEIPGGGGTPVRFASVSQTVGEGAGSVDLTILAPERPETDGQVTVRLVSGDPADLGGFTSETVTISSVPGAPTEYVVTIPITDDTQAEANEQFQFELVETAEGSSVSVGDPDQSIVTVVDNDGTAGVATVPKRDADGDGEEDGGPIAFSLPINGVTAGEVAAAAGADKVYVFDPETNRYVEAPDDLVLMAGQTILVDVAPGSELMFSGTSGNGNTTYSTGGSGGRVLIPVGNPTNAPISLTSVVIEGGTLSDILLIFDEESGAFVPVSIEGAGGLDALALPAYAVVIFQVTPDGEVTATVASDAPSSSDTAVTDASFMPTASETSFALLLSPGGGEGRQIASATGDELVLRFDIGEDELDPFDGVDLLSPLGGTLAVVAPFGGDDNGPAPFAAVTLGNLTPGEPVVVPLKVGAATPGTYAIALGEDLGLVDNRPIVVEILDGSASTVISDGEAFEFTVSTADAGDPDALDDRFQLRVSLGTAVAAEDDPEALALSVYPNPSAGAATVEVHVPEAGAVQVTVFDVLGREVARLHEGNATAGTLRLGVDAGQLAPGAYVVLVRQDAVTVTRRLTVTR